MINTLNKIFLKSENENDFESSCLLYADNQYMEINSTNCLAFNNNLDETFLIMCVNARYVVSAVARANEVMGHKPKVRGHYNRLNFGY